ncbi:hypothetical protein CHGG_05909 [Chaetomium globosum CBS 148.51]|uniref:Uncharacterized protein n=1 Tax=Chaetomium globosum (strain ATCC 6205 / CBS 148.51 / DSM 1962 / NBRC 6347 / NRRL 1970) TaxID=306901 RepID=Q2H606_CHAGB|nr:uncharacterized protein CHGG_05909 [Chaetomium globosum CBS 148.51]EAQ89290.1 hypothetical protein CHGG_05909 [Chaetomium globosum CBS 148.51]
MRAGRGSIGKVEIDCRFMFTKSHWGVIGESKNPGGIIYLDLDFSQPADCRLESATITVTLTEDDGEEARIQHRSACPVKFTDHYGPKCVRGPESFVQTKKIQNRTPEVQLFGYGAGGLGMNREKIVQTRGRWDFSGYISSTKESIWYNRLRWELKENSLEWQPTHSNLFHTAFALEHNATRFYMTVHVSGKLAKLSDKIKNKLKFGEKGSKDQEIVTKIEWAEGYSCPLRLDEVARDLHEAMGYANMTKVPVEIPDALAASYHPAVTNPVTPTLTVQPPPDNPQVPQIHPLTRPCLEPRPSGSTGETSMMGNPVQHLPGLTLEELSMAAAGFAYHPSHPPRPPPLSTSAPPAAEHEAISESSSSVTLVDSAVPTQVGEGESEPASDTGQKGWKQKTDKSKSKVGGGMVWLGVTAMLLYWLGKVGVLLSGLASVVAVPSTPTLETPKGKKRNKNKVKMIGADGASESSRTRTSAIKLGYLVRGRPRGRRGQRPYLNVDVGRRKRQQWEDIESNSSN